MQSKRSRVLAGVAAAAVAIGAGFGAGHVSSSGTTTTTVAEPCPSSVSSIAQGGCSKETPPPPGQSEAPRSALSLGAGYPNGHFPMSALAPITGGVTCAGHPGAGHLVKQAAAAWNHIAVKAHKATGYWLQSDGCASSYRDYGQQVDLRNYWCGQGSCANAAVPGTSNHGIGQAVDGPPQTVAAVKTYGHGWFGQGYGSCSDAPWESWHIKYCGGYHGRDPGPNGSRGPRFKPLQRGDHGERVKQLSTRLAVLRRPTPKHPHYIAWKRRSAHFSKAIAYAIRRLQRDCHLSADGVYGPKTNRCIEHRWAAHKGGH